MSQSLAMSGDVKSTTETARPELDRAVEKVKEKATEFARLAVAEKRRLLEECLSGLQAVAADWVAAACRAKGLAPDRPSAGEEWLGGPSVTVRNVRLLIDSLAEIERAGKPRLGAGVHTRADGRVEIDAFPASGLDKAVFAGFTNRILLQPGIDAARARDLQASFYGRQSPAGGLSLVLGAGNVSSIPPMDAFYKLFVDGNVCVLKMNPVNEYVGPFLERALQPLIRRGYLGVTYGGGDAGSYLVQHPAVDDIHITGSDRTHDLIVWGPPGPERERRMREDDPLLKKTITSELGNVSPVAIVPGQYSDEELWFQARSVVSMVANNASFNCNAAKVLITSAKWPQRETFQKLLARALSEVPLRKAYYPGAEGRYQKLTAGRNAQRFGTPAEGELAWAFIPGVDATQDDELFVTEPFCGILSETALAPADPVEFLAALVPFCNDRLWGTLNATIIVHPLQEKDPTVAAALDRAILELRYGAIAINHWPALVYGFVTPPWGGHPSATLKNIQSGLGWVHNTFMIEGIEKSVVRGPITVSPKPAWFYDNRATHKIGPKLVAFEAAPSWLKVPGMAITALQG